MAQGKKHISYTDAKNKVLQMAQKGPILAKRCVLVLEYPPEH